MNGISATELTKSTQIIQVTRDGIVHTVLVLKASLDALSGQGIG